MGGHHVVTQDYPENLSNGILVCGINFGYSQEDEYLDAKGHTQAPEASSFFSDKDVNNSRFRTRLLNWLALWEVELATEKGQEGALERSFWQTNWLDTQTRSLTSDGKINNETLVENADGILGLIEQRRPSVILFLGSDLIEALNDIRLRERVVSILGPRPDKATVLRTQASEKGKSFQVVVQSFGDTSIVSLPHPQAIGLTNEQIASVQLPEEILRKLKAR